MSERIRRHFESARKYARYDTGWSGPRPGTIVAILIEKAGMGGFQIRTVSSWTAPSLMPKLSLVRPRYRVLEVYEKGERIWPRERMATVPIVIRRPVKGSVKTGRKKRHIPMR